MEQELLQQIDEAKSLPELTKADKLIADFKRKAVRLIEKELYRFFKLVIKMNEDVTLEELLVATKIIDDLKPFHGTIERDFPKHWSAYQQFLGVIKDLEN